MDCLEFENPGLELYGRVNGGEISNGGKGLNELLAKARATLAAQDAGKVSTSIIGKQVPPSQWDKNAGVSGDGS